MMNKIRAIRTNKWMKFTTVAVCYLLWVIWLGNYWWLVGLPVIFDLYISKKVRWAFWKKNYRKGEKRNAVLDWIDAIIFALVAATFLRMYFLEAYMIPTSSMERSLLTGDYLFVSKVAYGPRVPETPLSLPLVHNTLPIVNTPSYAEWIRWDYRRLAGFGSVERDEVVVFGFPHGDTVLSKAPQEDYYKHVRFSGAEYVQRMLGPVIVRPTDKKDNYVKRCVAVAGDSIEIRAGKAWVNGLPQKVIDGIQYTYTVRTNGMEINERMLDKWDVSYNETRFEAELPGYSNLPLTEKALEALKKLPNIVDVVQNNDVYPPDYPDSPLSIFPFTASNRWTRDNFGPLWVPKKDATVALTVENLPLYQRIISVYEHNTLEVRDDDRIYINGQPADSYTFRMNYYFMMGDNRHNSLDSRYWGFVPENHVVGKPAFIWFSTDRYKSFPKNIRWGRLFKGIK
jgi:signal peptidase I